MRLPHRDLLNLVVPDHGSQLRAGPLGVGHDPGAAEMRDVGNGAVAFQFQLAPAGFEPGVQLVQVLFGLRDHAIEPRNRLALDLTVQVLAQLEVLAIDQGIEAQVHMARHALHLGGPVAGRSFAPRLKHALVEELLDELPMRQGELLARSCRAGGCRRDRVEVGGLAQCHLPCGRRFDAKQTTVERVGPPVFDRGGEHVEYCWLGAMQVVEHRAVPEIVVHPL